MVSLRGFCVVGVGFVVVDDEEEDDDDDIVVASAGVIGTPIWSKHNLPSALS
jgi:hypothetical protein